MGWDCRTHPSIDIGTSLLDWDICMGLGLAHDRFGNGMNLMRFRCTRALLGKKQLYESFQMSIDADVMHTPARRHVS